MRFGCRVLIGAVLLAIGVAAIAKTQEFPIVLYNALSPDSIADPDSQYTLMKNLGATHLLGEATDSMVSLAAATRPMSRLVTHGRELRPNTSFNRTPCGGLPQGAG
jgi:hypothetical protein